MGSWLLAFGYWLCVKNRLLVIGLEFKLLSFRISPMVAFLRRAEK